MIKKVGKISFDDRNLDVYGSMNEPLFAAYDVAEMLGYDDVHTINDMCEADEVLKAETMEIIDGWKATSEFVTENGLYNVLSQSRALLARKWRKIIHEELIQMRKEKGFDISEQFEDWNDQLDSLYYDEDTGMLMQSITVHGGDVIQVPFNKEAM